MAETFGIVANRRKPDIAALIGKLRSWLEEHGVRVTVWDDLRDMVAEGEFKPIDDLAKESDIVVALGGDGTLLRAARAVGDRMTPILGVNIGSLGFLTEVTVEEVHQALGEIVAGNYRYEDRMNVDASVERGGTTIATFTGLNDMVINKGALYYGTARQFLWQR